MNVDDAMETAAAYWAAHEQEQEPLFDSEEVAITLANEVGRLRAELEQYKKSLPVCEKHKPDSGCRSGCMICGLQKQSSALSRIDYACEEPNEMQISLYDLDYDEERVVEAVRHLKSELNAAKAASVCPVKIHGCFYSVAFDHFGLSSEDSRRFDDWLRDRVEERVDQ